MKRRDENQQEHTHSSNFFKRILISLCLISISMITWKAAYAVLPDRDMSKVFAQSNQYGKPNINLSVASGATIPFTTHNSPTTNQMPDDLQDIPHLVLTRNGELTAFDERTLNITLSNLEVPAAGITVTLKLETQHGDPDLGGDDRNRISVWQESRRIEPNQSTAQAGVDARFEAEFGETSLSDRGVIPTPTDYYRLEVQILDAGNPYARALFSVSQDYAFLLERQWVAPLSSAISTNQAGPRELVVYACDMFPFRGNAANRFPRTSVPDYIQYELLPQMMDAIHLQTESWGFSWDGWVSFSDSTNTARLEVALSDGETWYHAPVPERGNSAIAINVNGGDNADYDTLTDGLLSTFHHELFHNLQRALALSSSGSGDVDGMDAAWQYFAEGTAALVPSVAQPRVQFSQTNEPRAYVAKAVQFVGGRGFPGELNSSLLDVNPYHGAMYWRFLYEQCGGMADGTENPGAGMAVIRRVLQVLYSREIVDINASTDLVRAMPRIMDRVLTSPEAAACPFRTYEASLIHFARAIYSLRLEGGRCTAPGVPAGCGFYDPASLYSEPKASKLSYAGQEIIFSANDQLYPAGIRSSFGIDFIDLQLRPGVQGQTLTIELHPQVTAGAEFNLQVIRLQKQGKSGFSDRRLVQVAPPEMLENEIPGAVLRLSIPAVELDSYNQIGIIITRVDAQEQLGPAGAYNLVVKPGG